MTSRAEGRRVLIIEDEGMVAMLLETMLAELGCEVAGTAATFERAAELIGEARMDLAILDVNLDGESSYPLAAMLKTRGIPFVFATGYGAAGLPEEWKTAPILQKPFLSRELDEALSALAGGAAAGARASS